ncbi:MAG TPA: FtsK/SpoIIIE domain-containing protein [Anaerolineaceae bacterium]|nr:FtsK/SpoIIIE domain-containing protein [Anaerolineaceae bacterium]
MSDLYLPQNNYALTDASQHAISQALGDRLLRLLKAHTIVPNSTPAFNLIPLPDRLLAVLNPIIGDLPDTTWQALRVHMQGRRVIKSQYRNGRLYTFLQISYWPARVAKTDRLLPVPLNLDGQPSPYHFPVGMTASGPLWLSILEMDSVLIGGARRMGKTCILHAWIQAAQRGGVLDLYLWDGKGGVEFGRYQGHPHTHLVADLSEALARVQQEVLHRQTIFGQVGVTNLSAYMKLANQPETLRPIVLFLDELADLPEAEADALASLVRRAGAYGVHPVVGIQRPDAEVLKGQLRANLATRISLPVVSPADSRIILQRSGADRLSKIKGRMMLVWEGRLIEAQSFTVQLPENCNQSALPVLTALEANLVQAALEMDGWFRIRELTEALRSKGMRVGRDAVNDVARRWEALGLLTATQTDASGYRLGRRITPALEQTYRLHAGSGGQADLADGVD